MRLVNAPADREWMAQTNHQFAKRCLPLLVANQAGWHLLNDRTVTLEWDGGSDPSNLRVSYPEDPPGKPATSYFGHGIATWRPPYLFRTPPGYNLLVRGPANRPKDGIQALEGLVETDWSTATFTVNWQMTRPGLPVTFEADEPIALLVPQRRSELARFAPAIRELDSDPGLAAAFRKWRGSRKAFLYSRGAGLVRPTEWQKDYFRGRLPDAVPPAQHEVRLGLRSFEP